MQVESDACALQKGINAQVRLAGIHARAGAGGRAESIADCVLDLEGDELKASERALLRADLHLDRIAGREPVRPRQVVGGPIQILLAAVAAVKDAPEHPAGDPAFQVYLVAKFKGAGKLDAAGGDDDGLGAQLLELVLKQGLQPTRAGGEEGDCHVPPRTHQIRRVPDFWSVTGSPVKKLTCHATMLSLLDGVADHYISDLLLEKGWPSRRAGPVCEASMRLFSSSPHVARHPF